MNFFYVYFLILTLTISVQSLFIYMLEYLNLLANLCDMLL